MSDEAVRIAREALELADKATPGPWKAENLFGHISVVAPKEQLWKPYLARAFGAVHGHYGAVWDDAEFSAFARTALPLLARAVLEMAEELDRVNLARDSDRASMWAAISERDQERADAVAFLKSGGTICNIKADQIERAEHVGASKR